MSKITVAQIKTAVDEFGAAIVAGYARVTSARLAMTPDLHSSFVFWGEDERVAERHGSWVEFAEEKCPGESRNSLYRLRLAGELLGIIGADAVGDHTERHLEPLGRLISGEKTEDERTLCEESVREVFASVTKDLPAGKTATIDAMTAAVEKIKPSKKKTKGKKSPTAPKTDAEETPADTPSDATLGAAKTAVDKYLASLPNDTARKLAVEIIGNVAPMFDAYGATAVLAAVTPAEDAS